MNLSLTDEQRSWLNGRLVIASISGGKDSAALSLWLTENSIEHRRVHALTGWDHQETLDYLRGPLTKALGPIDEVQGRDGGMAALILRKGMFPSRMGRFCTEQLKVLPMIAYVKRTQDEVGDVVNAVGIRAAESEARSKMPEREWSDDWDCDVWRPLIQWTESDVIEIHQRHGLAPHPFYLRYGGLTRIGCWPCIFARKSEIRLVSEVSPERIDEIRELEAEVAAAFNARRVRDGKEPAPAPTFFRSGVPGSSFAPIDAAVEWSKTDRGGKQFLLLDNQPEGCVRWGLCEAGANP